MTNLHKEMATSPGEEDFDYKIQFVQYGGTVYVEIVPISKKYFGKAVKGKVLKFKDWVAWYNFLEACGKLENWIQSEGAWNKE